MATTTQRKPRRTAADRILLMARETGPGPYPAGEVKERLNISQPTWDRACKRLKVSGHITKVEWMTPEGKRALWTVHLDPVPPDQRTP